ncbi:MAG: FHA domain-containing protein [Chloroflexi bacterium]|nr:FHA domain-containing protein [Chloroflexota bacterium]
MTTKQTHRQGQQAVPGKGSKLPRLLTLGVLLVLVFGLAWAVHAQVDDTLLVLPPNTGTFPLLFTQIQPIPFPGIETAELHSEGLSITENGRAVEVISLDKQYGGMHFTLVINGDRRFDLHDANGETPFDRVQMALESWVNTRRFSANDTLSLVTPEGPLVRNSIDRNAWVEALKNYQPNFRAMTPNLVSIETALHLSEEWVVPFGVAKTLLYITPPPTPEEINPLLVLAETARAAEIQVNVWLLGEELFLNNDQGKALINLTNVTGGEFFHYGGVGALPNPESYFENIGVYYDLAFKSSIRQEGTYAIVVETADGAWRGESRPFYINVQPPRPILLSPPAKITRFVPEKWDGKIDALQPKTFTIEFLLEFPDNYSRDLKTSRLYVDGRLVAERVEAPFTALKWDLVGLDETGEHLIQVRVEDSLGLTGETITMPVMVELLMPATGPQVSIQRIGLVIVSLILAAAVLAAFVWGVRYLLGSELAQQMFRKAFGLRRKPFIETSPVVAAQNQPVANLLPVAGDASNWKQSVIQITQQHTNIGSDPGRANLVLDGEDIEGLHARLRFNKGSFWLSDCGSMAGTWINYNAVGPQPVQLAPGDLIHIGDTGFRFTLIDVEAPPAATIEKYKLK